MRKQKPAPLFNLSLEPGRLAKGFTKEEVALWHEHSEFSKLAEALAANRLAMGRVQQIRQLFGHV